MAVSSSRASKGKNKKTKYYAYLLVNSGRSGITTVWSECQAVTSGNKARYKSFPSESDAKKWLAGGAIYEPKTVKDKDGTTVTKTELIARMKRELAEGIYFDAGTGRGIGTEVRVTDRDGHSIIDKVVPVDKITEHGNYLTKPGSTNNYGELLGMYCALKIGINDKIWKIFGDSKLVIEYWSKGAMKRAELPSETVELGDRVIKLRKQYEALGGTIEHVSGDINPADLGFHKS